MGERRRTGEVVALLDAINLRDVGMVQRRQNLGFALKPRQPLGILGEGGGQHLDCYITVEAGVAGTVDLTHAARPNGATIS